MTCFVIVEPQRFSGFNNYRGTVNTLITTGTATRIAATLPISRTRREAVARGGSEGRWRGAVAMVVNTVGS